MQSLHLAFVLAEMTEFLKWEFLMRAKAKDFCDLERKPDHVTVLLRFEHVCASERRDGTRQKEKCNG